MQRLALPRMDGVFGWQEASKMLNKHLLTLTAGHTFADLSPGALPAMLPFFIAAGGGMNYTQAAGLSFAVSLSSTITQPVFGFFADKTSKAWLMPLGILLSGCGLSAMGFFPENYWLMFSFAIICGIGVAAYHPEGARMANRISGKKKAGSMSIFTVGGTVGMALGPALVTPAFLYMGLRGSAVLAIPAIIMCVLFFFLLPGIRRFAEEKEKVEKPAEGGLKNEWLKFIWLSVATIARSVINHSLTIFLPLYWISVLHQSKAASAMVLSFMTIIGAVVLVAGGYLADRFGINRIIKAGWILLIPSLFILTKIANPFAALMMLIPISVGNYLVNSPMIVMGQKYLPKNIGFASGITMGLGNSIGGVITPLLGRYADAHGLTAVLGLISILPLLGIVIAFTSRAPALDQPREQ